MENKLLCCTADGYFYVIEVEMSGAHRILATHHDNENAEINFVKWHIGKSISNYFICGGHRGLEIYRFSETPQESLWNIEKAAIRFTGGIKTWKLNITKEYTGCDLISLNFINLHGKRRKFGINMTPSTSTYFSCDFNRQIGTEDRYMAFGREDGRIEIYACDDDFADDDYHSIGESAAHMDIITCMKWSPWTKGMLASGSLDGTVKFWMIDDVTDALGRC
ncbi:unnamed protein product [Urochloa humidicola]